MAAVKDAAGPARSLSTVRPSGPASPPWPNAREKKSRRSRVSQKTANCTHVSRRFLTCLAERNFRAVKAPGQRRGRGSGGPISQEIGAWIHISEEGKISVFTGKVEIGQNIRTSLSQVVAEELRVGVEAIHMVMADT